ncbi:hypothetical protein [Pedobacter sp.]|uniref:hypothetical protein n=1 Tax=Pedobacter sp. TaxID=1411316 RepID=UPI003D7FB143
MDIDGCRRFILTKSIIDSDDAIVLKSTGKWGCSANKIANWTVSNLQMALNAAQNLLVALEISWSTIVS